MIIKQNSLKPFLFFLLILFLFYGCGGKGGKGLTVIADKANVRSSPGVSSKNLVFSVGKYYPFKYLSKKKDWYRVQDFEGEKGWVHKSLIGKKRSVVVKINRANVRKGPDRNKDVVFYAEKGCALLIVSEKGDWIEVMAADGAKGWIHKGIVWSP